MDLLPLTAHRTDYSVYVRSKCAATVKLRALHACFLVASLTLLLPGCASLKQIKLPELFASDTKPDLSQEAQLYQIVALDSEHAAQASEAEADYRRALKSMAEGNNLEAMVLFQSIAARFPKLAGPWINQALIHLRLREYELAKNKLETATAIYPDHAYAHNYLGIAQKELGQFKQAKASYIKALSLNPNYAKAHYNLGVLYELYFRDFKLALQHFEYYQTLLDEPDRTVSNWQKDLSRRIKSKK